MVHQHGRTLSGPHRGEDQGEEAASICWLRRVTLPGADPQMQLPGESDLRLAFYCDKEKEESRKVYLEKVPALCLITLGEGGPVHCG